MLNVCSYENIKVYSLIFELSSFNLRRKKVLFFPVQLTVKSIWIFLPIPVLCIATSIREISTETQNEGLEELQPIEPEKIRQAKCGKPAHRIWSDAFDQQDVQSIQCPNNAICKHCKESVRHHHKTLSVETHLRKCKPYKKIMMDMAVKDRPDWWNDGVNGASKKAKVASSCSSKSISSFSNSTQSSLKSFVIPHLSPTDQKN